MATLGVAALLVVIAWAAPWRGRAVKACVAGVLVTVMWVAVALPWWAGRLQGPLKAMALQARGAEGTYVQWRMHQPSLAVYQQRELLRRSPAVGELAWTRLDRLGASQGDTRWEIVEQRNGYALVRWLGPASADTLPEPKPERAR